MPTPAPTPAPTPTPTPTVSPYAAEDARSIQSVTSKADAAYAAGLTGKGVTVAIIDTGINASNSEFAGRISADSTAFDQQIARCATCSPETVRFDIKDNNGHGTATAAVALAARDTNGIHGIAPEATLLALKINAPDMSKVTPTSGPIPESSSPNGDLVAPAVTYAVQKDAFVISLSLNGSASGTYAVEQRLAMDSVRTQNRLLVESVSNDNGVDSFAGQIAENIVGSDLTNKDWFLFGIRVDKNLTAPSGNGNPGVLADRTLAVVAVDVPSIGKDGEAIQLTGNSFAAPAIAGAAALLKQYWPQLGGKQISRILLDTATDLGTPGVDQLYGAGLLNVEKSLKPQAPAAAFVAADTVLARFSSLTLSAPFGGSAVAGKLAGRVSSMTVLDRYGRDYAMTATSGIRSRGSGLLAGAMLGSSMPTWIASASDRTRVGLTSTTVGPRQGVASNAPAFASFSPGQDQTVTLGANVAVGQGTGLTGSPLRGIGLRPVGISSGWSGHGWSAGFASGTSRDRRGAMRTASFSTPVGLGLEVTGLTERGQALGLVGDAALGIRGADTTMATLTARRIVAGVVLTARATASTTRVRGGSDLLRFDRTLVGTAFAVEGAHSLFGGSATLGLSSPLRLERASASVLTPVSYDLITGALTTRAASVDLTPRAREIDLELGWAAALSRTSSLRFGIARAFDAGHVAGATDTAGYLTLALR